MNSADTSLRLGVPQPAMLLVAVPGLAATVATGTLFWGAVALLSTGLLVASVAALKGSTPLSERSWFGVPAAITWVVTAAAISGGKFDDASLFSLEALSLAGVVLALDALIRGKLG